MPKKPALLPSGVFIAQDGRRPVPAAPSADRHAGAAPPLRALIGELVNGKQTRDLRFAIGR